MSHHNNTLELYLISSTSGIMIYVFLLFNPLLSEGSLKKVSLRLSKAAAIRRITLNIFNRNMIPLSYNNYKQALITSKQEIKIQRSPVG